MHRQVCLIVLLLVSASYAAVKIQPYPVRCDRISLAEGLSQSTVSGIVQDYQGFLWFATEGGLNRYDGQKITTFKHELRNSNSLSHNIIMVLCLDRSGMLWIGTESGGLNRFDPVHERFTRFAHDPVNPLSLGHNRVQAVCEDHTGTLWVGTAGGLDKFDREKGVFVHYRHEPDKPSTLSHDNVLVIFEDSDGALWVGTSGGLNQFDRIRGQFSVFRNDPANPRSLLDDQVFAIAEGKERDLWIGTSQGVSLFNRKDGWIRISEPAAGPLLYQVRALFRDRSGAVWIGAGSGLYRADSGSGPLTQYTFQLKEPQGNGEIRSILEDQSGIVWVGTQVGGVIKINPAKEKFVYHELVLKARGAFSSNMVLSLLADRSGTVWIGTPGDSPLSRIDSKTGQLTRFNAFPEGRSGAVPSSIYAICQSRAEPSIFWIGTAGGGLIRYDWRRKTFQRFVGDAKKPASLSGDYVWAVLEDSAGTLWIGTEGGGLNQFDPRRGTFAHILHDPTNPNSLSHNVILCLYEAPSLPGVIWIGTAGGGLNRYDLKTGQFTSYRNDPRDPHSISDNSVSAILETKFAPGILWVGTGDGLNRFDWKNSRFDTYSREEGLAEASIGGILDDKKGNLWMSTLKGIARFDLRESRFRNYDAADGVQVIEFNRGACCQSADGTMYFGGINGVVSFSPETILPNPHVPPVVLLSGKVFDRELLSGPANFERPKISLPYTDNFLSFEFAALDFRAPAKNQYAYMMEGLDKSWVDCGNRNFARYPNLAPGDYVFRVRGANNDGVWNTDGTSLSITIASPFWRTGWFTAAVIIAFAAVSYFVIEFSKNYFMLIAFWKRRHYFGHYQTIDPIGRGGTGTVYRAVDRKSRRPVALKVLDSAFIDEAGRRRFIQEGLICERLDHPNVVKVLQRGEAHGQLYYVMEEIAGVTLKQIIGGLRLDLSVSTCVFSVLLDIVQDIHLAGIIHRDIKPENIMIAAAVDFSRKMPAAEWIVEIRNNLKILDFGLAKILGHQTLTRTSLLSGTLQYMPPESLYGKKVREPNYDFYSLGVVFYELLTGAPPFHVGESFETIAAIIGEDPPLPTQRNQDIPKGLSDLVMRMIEKKPSNRLAEYAQIRELTDNALAGL